MMWQLIRANKRRSVVLAFFMLLLLLAMGFAIGAPFGMPENREYASGTDVAIGMLQSPGGLIGMGIAFGLWVLQAIFAYFMGGRLLLAVSGAKEIKKEDHPQLFNVVEEMTIASRLPIMPKVYVIEDMALNAFATGRDPDHAAVAVTAGLLQRLNRDQLQGVIAHEIAHIVHRDVLFMTMIGVMLGTIVMISEVVLRSVRVSMLSAGRYRGGGNNRNNGAGMVVFLLLALVLAIIAPLLAQLIYFAVSRKREYLADAGAAVYTRYPEGLAQALEVISGDSQILGRANRATAPMYIINPLMKAQGAMRSFFSTHPPTQERIQVLRGIVGGVSYAKYQEAWRKAHKGGLIPRQALQEGEECPIRRAETSRQDHRKQVRETGDMLRNLHHFIFLACACGMRVKVPPEYKKDSVDCPRCHRHLEVAQAELAKADAAGRILGGSGGGGIAGMASAGAAGVAGLGALQNRQGATPPPIPKAQARSRPIPGATGTEQEPLVIHRKGDAWESFKCSCGAVKNIAPSFDQPSTNCSRCGRVMLLQNAPN